MNGDPHEWHIESDREGFFIADEYGEEINPPWLAYPAQWRCQSYSTAKQVLHETITDAIDNYEPNDTGDAWTGGFASDH